MEKYLLLENKLKNIINVSEPHTPLPSLSQIMKTYNVSTTTARKALSDLNNQGVIYTVNGKGSFVSPHYKDFPEVYCVFQGIIYKNNFSNDTGLFPFLLEELCTVLTENNMEMIFSLYKNSLDLERQILQRLPEKNPFGAIIYATGKRELYPLYQKLVEMIPNTVFVDRYIEGIKANYVGTDNYNGARLLCEKIADKNFDKIIYIDSENPKSNVCGERKKGFVDTFVNTDNEKKCIYIENDLDNYDEYMKKLFSKIKIEIKKCKKVCIFGVNSVIIQEIYNECVNDLEKLDFFQVLCFEKPYIELLPNMNLIWAKQDINGIANACVKIVKKNEKKRKKSLFSVKIIEEN